MRFAHVTISVRHLDESLHFYEKIIGLPVVRRFPAGPGREIVFLGNNNETEIELISGAPENTTFGQGISLGFAVASLDETIRFLQDNGISVGEVLQPNPSVKMTFVTDPDGLRIQFIEQAE